MGKTSPSFRSFRPREPSTQRVGVLLDDLIAEVLPERAAVLNERQQSLEARGDDLARS